METAALREIESIQHNMHTIPALWCFAVAHFTGGRAHYQWSNTEIIGGLQKQIFSSYIYEFWR